ncbi:hypothetical protein [Desulfovibrio sp. JC010]|uniref:hypothetical protein n=1 Tax=Desulfovibrio sp. JC010 TaxID=2593641 RepID=UPI0013D2E76A|nr:hypothetical protein [Desulfovibrio sp. JC010]NDV27498.1 hypothetical protein [Desulfovibrio sp. JC010]
MIWNRLFSRFKKKPQRFQKLTEDDLALYGKPEVIALSPPETDDPRCREKADNWIAWKGAPYPAQRHSEYLDVPGASDRILLSAILRPPVDVQTYLAGVDRKTRYRLRGVKAEKEGYICRRINPAEHAEGIWEVVQSASVRQGRPIESGILARGPEHDFPEYVPYSQPMYQDICIGAFSPDGVLAAYILGKRVGQHVQYDEIMAHAAHRKYDVMHLLHLCFLDACMTLSLPPGILHYGPWYSGANPFSPEGGLNKWKRKVGFRPAYLVLRSS